MADLGGLADKAKDFANTEKGEQVTDGVIKKGDDAVSSATGGKFDEKIDAGREAADKKIGE